MARQTAAVQTATSEGVTPAPVASHIDGHAFANDGQTMVILENGTAGSVNVTFVTGATVAGLAVADRVVAVPAGASRVVGHLHPRSFNQADGTVHVDFGTVDPLVTALYLR